MKRASLFVLFVCSFLPTIAYAQNQTVATGTPPFGTFGGGPDVINLGNLNAHLVIPVIQRPGRGMTFSFNLTYDSSVWTPVSASGTSVWTPATAKWGWTPSVPAGGTVSSTLLSETKVCPATRQKYVILNYVGWGYTDGLGTVHPFAGDSQEVSGCGGDPVTSFTSVSGDGTGYTLSVTGGGVNSLIAADGTNIDPFGGGTDLGDRNGNQITSTTSSGTTNYYDTLSSSTPVLTSSGSGTPASPSVYSYTAPSGASASYKAQYAAYTVQTNFGCTGISEFGPTSENLISEIDLPDIAVVPNDRYVFTYEATPGHPGNVTGRVASITLPTGGTINYTYTGGNNGIECADGSTAGMTRQTPDGTWAYSRSGTGTQWTTTINDPQANQTVIQFQESSPDFYETERQVYQLVSGVQTLLQTTNTCYNGSASPCTGTTVALPFSNITKTIQLPGSSNLECKHVTSFNSSGLLSEQDDYDYGSGAPGPLLREEFISYASLGAIIDAPSQIVIENGALAVLARTIITYDGTSVVATTGTPQHFSVSGPRGNPTSVSLSTGSTSLTKSFTYFDTGSVQTATDVNGAVTTTTYGACGNSYPTSVAEPLGLSKSITWNCTGGVETSATDENSQTVSTAYTDAYFWRPATSTDQESNVTNFNYQPNASFCCPPLVASSMTFNNGNSLVQHSQYKDSMGRTYTDQHLEAPGSTLMDTVSYVYDSEGRVASASGPCAVSWTLTCSGPTTTQTYDALNRPLVTTDGGGGTVTLSYTANDTLQTVGPAPTGENAKRKQSEYNSIGQLTSVCEITAGTTSAPAGTCGQTTPATGYWTKYTYDALGDLLTVTQNAQSASPQTRTYTYDMLGRMTSETNPETGTITNTYDAMPASCFSYGDNQSGNLTASKDASGNTNCYHYDALHRLADVGNSNQSATNACKRFRYDNSSGYTGSTKPTGLTNTLGRLIEAATDSCSTQDTLLTDEWFSYTPRGEVSAAYESTPHSAGYYTASATYWANGLLDALTGTGSYSTTYTPDGKGRVNSAAGALNQLKSTAYNPADEPTTVTLGNSDSNSYTYDPNTFRMTQYKYTIGATPQSLVGNLTWNANGSLGQLQITDPFNATNTQTCNYTHDDLARVASGNCGSVWSQTFSYDAFGNITKAGSNSFNPGYNTITNRMSTGATYDANGDVLTDSLHSYAWDVYSRPTTIDTVTVTYDALGRMVEQTKAGVSTEIQYAPSGFKMQMLSGQTVKNSFVPLPGGTVFVPQCACYFDGDWLGGSRFSSTYFNRTMKNDLAYAPYGEQYAAAGAAPLGLGNVSFAGNNEDTATNLYDAQFREYEPFGRWPSPDPAGIAAASPANPQSWNRYAYVMNNPLSSIDPSGLSGVTCHDAAKPPCSIDTSINAFLSSESIFSQANEFLLMNIPVYALEPTPVTTRWNLVCPNGRDSCNEFPVYGLNNQLVLVGNGANLLDLPTDPFDPASSQAPTQNPNKPPPLTQQQCNLLNEGLNQLTDLADIWLFVQGTQFPLVSFGEGYGISKTNQYINNKLCGGPQVHFP